MTKECGQYLSDECSEGLNRIYSPINSLIEVFDAFRHMLQEGEIEKRTQYVIEQLFAVRRTHFQEYPRLAPELDLVEDGDQITHRVGLDVKSIRRSIWMCSMWKRNLKRMRKHGRR